MEKSLKTRKNVTPEDINKIKELYWQKAPHEYIAKTVGLKSVDTVKRILMSEGVGYKHGRYRDNTIRIADVDIDPIKGEIRKKYNGEKLTEIKDKDGYSIVVLDGKQQRVHRLIAENYLANDYNKPTVNHINGIKDDNRLENLEWATYSEQNIHSINVLNNKTSVPTQYIHGREIVDLNTGIKYKSVSECAKSLGVSRNVIYRGRLKNQFKLLDKEAV